MTNEKNFPNTLSQWELDYDLFTNLPRIITLLAIFLRVPSNSKEVSYLSWHSTYPNLKNTCCIKLKFFLWTKLLENLHLAKYLISVGAPLSGTMVMQYLFLNTIWLEIRDSRFRIQDSRLKKKSMEMQFKKKVPHFRISKYVSTIVLL